MNLFIEPIQLVFSLLYISLLDASFMFLYACTHDTIFNTCSFDSDLLIHMCLSLHATWQSPYHSLGSSDSPRSFCPDFRVWSLWILPVADQRGQWKRGSSADRLKPHPSRPPCSDLEFFFYDSEPPFVQFIIVYLFVFSQLRHIGDIIFL